MADLETDAAQSNAGDGSHLQQPEDPAPARQESSFESITTNLQILQRRTQEQISLLQMKADGLEEKLKKVIEEKEIWMTRCQRMENRLAVATGGGDGDFADPTGTSGEKQLEILLQENEFFKSEINRLNQRIAAFESRSGAMDRQNGELDYPDSGPVEDEEPDGHSTQPTGADDSRAEHTFDASPFTPDITQNTDQGGIVLQPQPQLSRTESLSDRRDIHINIPMAGGPGYVPSEECAGRDSRFQPQDAGDQRPNQDMLLFLAKKMPHTRYKDVLRSIGLNDNKIADVEYKYPRDPQECRFQTFQEWKQDGGIRATLRKLVNGMISSDVRNVAESFCEKFDLIHLLIEYDQYHPELTDEPETPITPGMPFTDEPDSIGPVVEEREMEPLEKIIAPLMILPSNYGDDFKLLLEEAKDRFVNDRFTEQQIESFVNDQKWRNDSKLLFRQELELLNNDPTVLNILTCWAIAIQSIFDSNRNRYTKIDRRKHVWRMMQSLRRSHSDVFDIFVREEIFPGGVVGLNPETAKKMVNGLTFNHHNKMKLLLQQTQENGHDWRGLAAKIPQINQGIITSWTQKGHDVGAENTLRTYGTSQRGTVQKLYEDLIDIERTDAAKVLED